MYLCRISSVNAYAIAWAELVRDTGYAKCLRVDEGSFTLFLSIYVRHIVM